MDADRSEPAHLRGLDGLRGLAICLVILWHVAVVTRFPVARLGLLHPLVYTGWAGVDLFFALSGFLITTLLLREERRNAARGGPATFSLKRFYIRRALRILPVFYAVFALLVFGLARDPAFRSVTMANKVLSYDSPLGLWPYALFFGNYFESYVLGRCCAVFPGDAFLVFWSLCVEEHFYLLWPLALRLVPSGPGRVRLALAVCAALPALRYAVMAWGLDIPYAVHIASHYRFDSIVWGALAALSLDAPWVGDRWRPRLLAASALVCAALILSGHLSVRPEGSPLGIALGLSALALTCTLVVVGCVRHPDSLPVRILERPGARLLGRLSYAMYLVHFPMIDLARAIYYRHSRAPTLSNLAALALLAVALSAALAGALHVAVERPFLRLKGRFT